MPTNKHQHIRAELKEIVESVDGLTVLDSHLRSKEPPRPYVDMMYVGWKQEGLSGRDTSRSKAIVQLVVNIEHAGGVAGITDVRDELDEQLEHAFNRHRISAFENERYTCTDFTNEYQGASGVLDHNQNRASFVATVAVEFTQTPL